MLWIENLGSDDDWNQSQESIKIFIQILHLLLLQVPQGIFDRNGQKTMNITLKVNETIDILVENMGHIGFGSEMNNNSKVYFTENYQC